MSSRQKRYLPPDDDDDDSPLDDFSTDQIKCPACRKLIFDDADRCPHCGDYILSESSGGKPRWVLITTWLLVGGWLLLVLISVVHWWMG